MKACRGNGVIVPRILNLGTRRSNTHALQSQLDMSLLRPQARSGRLGAEKNFLPLPGFETWTILPVA